MGAGDTRLETRPCRAVRPGRRGGRGARGARGGCELARALVPPGGRRGTDSLGGSPGPRSARPANGALRTRAGHTTPNARAHRCCPDPRKVLRHPSPTLPSRGPPLPLPPRSPTEPRGAAVVGCAHRADRVIVGFRAPRLLGSLLGWRVGPAPALGTSSQLVRVSLSVILQDCRSLKAQSYKSMSHLPACCSPQWEPPTFSPFAHRLPLIAKEQACSLSFSTVGVFN